MKEKGLSPNEVALYHQIERALTDDRPQALIVGGRPSNWSRDLHDHPNLRFMDRNDPKAWRKADFPRRIGCVICTRFIHHGEQERLERIMPPKGVTLVPQLLSTGVVRRVLRRLIEQSPRFARPEPAKTAELELRPLHPPQAAAPPAAAPEAALVRFTPVQMLRNSAVLESVLDGIERKKDAGNIVSGKACGQVVTQFTRCATTSQHIKLLISCKYLVPLKAEGGMRFSRYRVTDETMRLVQGYRVRSAGPTPTQLEDLKNQLDDYHADRLKLAELARRALAVLAELSAPLDEIRDLLERLAR